ncbi:sugar ABC transporter permease [Enterococcus durans]|uniref:Sugar ABC transporter permease n=1 Tax=Enterococcus durans TaxID=53345 RepID=A0A5N0YNV6_9ENTE|nr:MULTISPECIES: ABC transporter permease subunit [Enterococcus]KAA9178356.1 sugar ABC transporter permease [Enterococcus durans]KAA9184598.1 sugar ABC transporter permease [Enterococcus durans]KAA9185679.1 sugar ABC transporter permease [Enterococcus durans]KAA9189969.1 sugar ABC transporter permease [Enterococcus durans]KAA9191649.1 sugar ABC transporter permease [Enterococcus durans]
MKKLKKFYDQRQLHWMVIPGVAFMIVFNYIPIYGVIIAFKNYTIVDTMSSAPWVGLDNFKIIMEDSFFWEAVRNTLAISLMKLLLGFAIPIILAIMIFEMQDGRLKKVIQTVSYIPHFFSWIVLGGMMISWLSTNGFINQVLMALGLMDQGVNHLLDPDKYWWIAVLSDIWKEVGWGTILYLAGMSRIDPTFYEAARIDGASKLTQIRTITLPLLTPIISLNLILNVSGLLGSNLDQTLVLMNAQNQNKSEVINSFVYRMGLTQGNFSYATAVSLGISIISIILLILTDRMTRKMNNGRSVTL